MSKPKQFLLNLKNTKSNQEWTIALIPKISKDKCNFCSTNTTVVVSITRNKEKNSCLECFDKNLDVLLNNDDYQIVDQEDNKEGYIEWVRISVSESNTDEQKEVKSETLVVDEKKNETEVKQNQSLSKSKTQKEPKQVVKETEEIEEKTRKTKEEVEEREPEVEQVLRGAKKENIKTREEVEKDKRIEQNLDLDRQTQEKQELKKEVEQTLNGEKDKIIPAKDWDSLLTYEKGDWKDLFKIEHLEHLRGKVRLMIMDPPYGIGYKGFKWDYDIEDKDWVVGRKGGKVDFSYLERVEDFMTKDGMIFIFNTLKNCFLLDEYIKEHRPKWKSNVLYWLKDHFISMTFDPLHLTNVVEGIISIQPVSTVKKNQLTKWNHSTIFSHPSLTNLDFIWREITRRGFKFYQEDTRTGLAVEPTEGNKFIRSERTGQLYKPRILMGQDDNQNLTGNSKKPLTLLCEITKLYLLRTRPFEKDEYLVDLFSGAGSSTGMLAKIFNFKYYGCELMDMIYNHLENYVKHFQPFENEEDRLFFLKTVEAGCLCGEYKPAKRHRQHYDLVEDEKLIDARKQIKNLQEQIKNLSKKHKEDLINERKEAIRSNKTEPKVLRNYEIRERQMKQSFSKVLTEFGKITKIMNMNEHFNINKILGFENPSEQQQKINQKNQNLTEKLFGANVEESEVAENKKDDEVKEVIKEPKIDKRNIEDKFLNVVDPNNNDKSDASDTTRKVEFEYSSEHQTDLETEIQINKLDKTEEAEPEKKPIKEKPTVHQPKANFSDHEGVEVNLERSCPRGKDREKSDHNHNFVIVYLADGMIEINVKEFCDVVLKENYPKTRKGRSGFEERFERDLVSKSNAYLKEQA